MTAVGIGYTLSDNAFICVDDWDRAQELANNLSPDILYRILNRYAEQCCPMLDVFDQTYHWNLMQVECSNDLAFRSETVMKPLYEALACEAILSLKPNRSLPS